MTESTLKAIKRALPALQPDSHESFRAILNSEVKRNKENTLKHTPSIARDWQKWLSSDSFNWSIFATLTGQGGLTQKQLNRHVDKWFEMLVKRFNTIKPLNQEITEDNFKVFWVAETNTKNIQ